jgi:uncharacterized Rossmann fold enzyme
MRRSAYIIGGGASLAPLLKDEALKRALSEKITFGCNKAVEHFKCTHMVYHDPNFNTDIVKSFKGEGSIYAPLSVKGDDLEINELVTFVKPTCVPVCDLDIGIMTGNNCGLTALSIAVALGFNRIFLLGMDCKFDKKGRSHFHEGYGKKVNQGDYEGFAHWFELMGKHLKATRPETKVFNCSYISSIDMREKYFKRMYIGEAILER